MELTEATCAELAAFADRHEQEAGELVRKANELASRHINDANGRAEQMMQTVREVRAMVQAGQSQQPAALTVVDSPEAAPAEGEVARDA